MASARASSVACSFISRAVRALLSSAATTGQPSITLVEHTFVETLHVYPLFVDLGSQMLGVSGQLRSIAFKFVQFSSPLNISLGSVPRSGAYEISVMGDSCQSGVDSSNLDLKLISGLDIVDYRVSDCNEIE